ncbi:MAG: hypothetical protein ACM3H8_07340 [Sphingobacteriales bacterium]
MKKNTSWLAAFVLPTILLTLISCQKEMKVISSENSGEAVTRVSREPVTRAYRDSFEMWLRFQPDIAGGWVISNPNSHAWWPGYGDGNATHMGNVSIYFNQYSVRQPSGGIHLFSSPVTMFFATELQAYNVPPEVCAIVYDGKGNSVWLKNDPDGIPSATLSPTMITFSGTMYIIGGTGKFAGATGETTLTGYFNPAPLQANPNALLEGSIWHYGWIRY